MNKYINLKRSIWWWINIICLFIFVNYVISCSEIMLCDNSGESINELFVETTQEDDSLPVTGMVFRFKRKLFWYINAKKSGQFNSYDEFKGSYTSNKSLWKIIKDDLKRTQDKAYRDRLASDERSGRIANVSRESRNRRHLNNIERSNKIASQHSHRRIRRFD